MQSIMDPSRPERETEAHRPRVEAAVIGAGSAGLWAAAELQRRGVEVVVLECGDTIGASWRARYEGLRLNTVRLLSGLPGTPIPRNAGRWPTRDNFVSYLERFADGHRLDIRFGIQVTRVDHAGDGWRLETSAGDLDARFVVIATGYDRVPRIPDWPGSGSFAGELTHACEYSNAKPFYGRDVLVVGVGNSATEIATQLADRGAERVRVSMRTPVNLVPPECFGVPMTIFARLSELSPPAVGDRVGFLVQRLAWGDLSSYGMPRAPYGISTELRVKGLGPVMDRGFVAALKQGRIELVSAVERFDRDDLVLTDEARIRPEVVIAATGYRHGLEALVGHLGVLLPSGKPSVFGARTHPSAPHLYFNGFWLPASGQLPGMRRTSRRIARTIARERGEGTLRRYLNQVRGRPLATDPSDSPPGW